MRISATYYLVKPGTYQAPLFTWKVTSGKLWAQADAAANGHAVRFRAESWLTPDFPHGDFWLDGAIAAPRQFDNTDSLEPKVRLVVEDALTAFAVAYNAHLAAGRARRARAKSDKKTGK